jgi:predicted alpha/beta superfamily hydrolase
MVTAFLIAAAFQQQQPIDPRRHTLTGGIETINAFESKTLNNKRNILIYLPPGYEETERRRYPVLYCLDGQNVFDGATSFIPGKEWRIDEAAQSLIQANLIEPIIIVAIENAGVARADEYLPTRFEFRGSKMGGKASDFAKFLLTELKPKIDRDYRTLPDRKNTGLLGSSLGGVATFYIGMKHPDRFSMLAVVSPSVWANDQEMTRFAKSLTTKPQTKIWVDFGKEEGPDSEQYTHAFVDALIAKKWTPGKDLAFYQDGFAGHNEDAWARRVPAMLLWLYRK